MSTPKALGLRHVGAAAMVAGTTTRQGRKS
jgi:hypothetical protein